MMKTAQMKDGRTMLLAQDADGILTPATVTMMVRPASSAPDGTRFKATLVAADGDVPMVLPFAVPMVQVQDGKFGPVTVPGFTPEFRLEMN